MENGRENKMRKLKNILVTGGAGFIGSNFIHYLFGLSSAKGNLFNDADFSGNVVNVDCLTYAGNLESLKEEKCTMDDMGAYLDYLNMTYFNTGMSFDDCRKLGDFIINVILSNEGKAMYFDGYDFEQRAYKIMNISYVSNEIVYLDSDVKRTSYRLT